MLKVNFSPYIVEIVLLHEVDAIKHKATVKDGVLLITLFKNVNLIWGAVERTGGKEELAKAKAESLKSYEVLNEELTVRRKDRKVAEEKFSLRKQMAIDENERTKLDTLKQEEKEAAEREVYEALNEVRRQDAALQSAVKKIEPSISTPTVKPINKFLSEAELDAMLNDDPQDAPSRPIDVERDAVIQARSAAEEELRYVPPPRSAEGSAGAGSKVDINFTPRVFPTPMRESAAANEEDWIAKNRRHLKNHAVLGKGLSRGNGVDISEEDPLWLKAKADDFFRAGDMHSALNAYSSAIDADATMTACYANRAACYLRLGLFDQCKLDCNLAIEQIQKAETSADNKVMLIKLLVRRSTAACQMGQFSEALIDCHQANAKFLLLSGAEASKLNGVSPETLQSDIARLKLLADTDALKKEADRLFGEGQVYDALLKYNEAHKLVPIHVSCLSNRSACKMALKDIEGCVEDCTVALDLLKTDTLQHHQNTQQGRTINERGHVSMLSSILPPVGSEKRKQWTVKTLTRRGIAHTQLDNADGAIADYYQACILDSSNKDLKADLEKLKELKKSSSC